MSRNIQFSGTYADLLAGLLTLTPKQLAEPIIANTEDQTFDEVALQITTEDTYYSGGDYQGHASDLEEEERVGCEVEPAGHVYITLY